MKFFNSTDARSLLDTYQFSIFPIHGVTEDGNCTCGNTECKQKGKHPATPNGLKDASNTIEGVAELWKSRKSLNVGIRTGEPSGVFVIDIDSDEACKAFYDRFDVPDTYTVTTAKGKHLYFAYPEHKVITKTNIMDGIDVRGDGGYVVGAGSNHATGHYYECVNPLEEFAECPQEILDICVAVERFVVPDRGLFNAPSNALYNALEGWTVEDRRKHLDHISPSCDYDTWIKIGMALHSDGAPFELWDTWSKNSPQYDGTTGQHWKSFNGGGGVSYGTVVALAKEGGWSSSPAPMPVYKGAANEEPVAESIKVQDSVPLPEPAPQKNKMFYIPARDITFNPEDNALVKDVLGQGEMSVIYGASNCGKTFFMTDIALSIARGEDWNGHRVSQGGVMYAALEGARGLSGRFRAYCDHYNLQNPDFPFAFMPCGLDFYSDDSNIDEFIDLIKSAQDDIGDPKLIVIDTLARAMAGGDENSGQDMGRLVHYSDIIRAETKAHLSFVHHSGKDKALGARGHSSLRAAVDTEIEVSREEDANQSVIKFVKQREIEMIPDKAFELNRIVIGTNNFSEELTSCVVRVVDVDVQEKVATLSPQERFIYECIIDAIEMNGSKITPMIGMQEVKAVSYEDFYKSLVKKGYKELYDKDGNVTLKNIKSATNTSRIRLRSKGKISFNADCVWMLN